MDTDVATFGMIVGGVSGSELVVGGLSSGGVWRPTVLRSIRHWSCTSMEVILNMQARDDCLFRLDLRSSIGYCMRIGGELGGVMAIRDVRGRCRKEGGRLDDIRVAY